LILEKKKKAVGRKLNVEKGTEIRKESGERPDRLTTFLIAQ